VAIRLPRKPSFIGTTAPSTPAPLTARARRRFAAMLKEASAILDHLPEPGESLHFLLSGTYDLTTMLGYLVTSYGAKCVEMRIATLAFSSRNTAELMRLVDSGIVGKLSLLASDFHRKHSPAEWAEAVQEFGKRGLRISAPRSHCKVVTMLFADGVKLALETSANARTNNNTEQATLFNDASVHDYHAAWIDQAHEVHCARESQQK
jgi:hypothetical protein